jgi:hypothetical protein
LATSAVFKKTVQSKRAPNVGENSPNLVTLLHTQGKKIVPPFSQRKFRDVCWRRQKKQIKCDLPDKEFFSLLYLREKKSAIEKTKTFFRL